MQLVMAGNDTQGLRYGTIETPEKYYLEWKEDNPGDYTHKLDFHLSRLCSKSRLLDIVHNYIAFDVGVKNSAAIISSSASRRLNNILPVVKAVLSGTHRDRVKA